MKRTGKYENRRRGDVIDISRTIWIFATNAVDPKIMSFWDKREAILSNEEDNPARVKLIKKLCKVIRSELKRELEVRPCHYNISLF